MLWLDKRWQVQSHKILVFVHLLSIMDHSSLPCVYREELIEVNWRIVIESLWHF